MQTHPCATDFLDIMFLVLLVRGLIRVFIAGFVLIRVTRHKALDGEENGFQALRRGPFLSSLTAPCATGTSARDPATRFFHYRFVGHVP